MAFCRVGHTHNLLDQRFGILGAKLARAPSMQSLDEYVSFVHENYVPANGVKLVVEAVHSIRHWREFVSPLHSMSKV